MAVIFLPRDADGRVIDPATGELFFDPVTGERRASQPGIGHGTHIVLDPDEPPFFPPGWEHLRGDRS